MVYVAAFLIFAALSAGSWYAAVALDQATTKDGELTCHRDYSATSVIVILAVTLSCFFSFPKDFYLGALAWGIAVYASLKLPRSKGAVLFAYLTLASLLTRIFVLGVMEMFQR